MVYVAIYVTIVTQWFTSLVVTTATQKGYLLEKKLSNGKLNDCMNLNSRNIVIFRKKMLTGQVPPVPVLQTDQTKVKQSNLESHSCQGRGFL